MDNKDKGKKKGFFARLIEKLDKKMQECAESKSCCGASSESKEDSCCSK